MQVGRDLEPCCCVLSASFARRPGLRQGCPKKEADELRRPSSFVNGTRLRLRTSPCPLHRRMQVRFSRLLPFSSSCTAPRDAPPVIEVDRTAKQTHGNFVDASVRLMV